MADSRPDCFTSRQLLSGFCEMRVLLTGPSGFVGRHAIPYLQAAGCELHTVDIRPLPDGVTGASHHIVDLLNARGVRDLMTDLRPSHLLHFAWCVSPGLY